jgi:hypothetical protein
MLVGCSGSDGAETSGSEDAAQYAIELQKDFDQGVEARGWLADPNHAMFETSKDQTLELVNKLYNLGCPSVKITDADSLTEGSPQQIAATVMAEMPVDPGQRKKLLELQAEVYGEDVEPDKGEKFLVLNLD